MAASSTLPQQKLSDDGSAVRAKAAADRESAFDKQRQQLDAERAALASAKAALEKAAARIEEFHQHLASEAEGQLLELALQIARKVLMQEIQAGRYEIDPILSEALAKLPPRQDVVVRLNPDDLSRSQLAAQETTNPGGGALRFVADAAVQRAECVLEMSEGVIESRTDTHMAEIVHVLQGPKQGDS